MSRRRKRNPETIIMEKAKDELPRRFHPSIALIYRINPGTGIPLGGSVPQKFAPEGWPDLFMLLRGHAIGLEAKTATGSPESSQVDMHRKWTSAGTPYIFFTSTESAIRQIEAALPAEVTAPATETEIAAWRASLPN